MYANTLERNPANLLQRIFGQPGTLTPRAKAKLARRERDTAYRANARVTTEVVCFQCGGSSIGIPIVRLAPFWARRGGGIALRSSHVPTNLRLVKEGEHKGEYVHGDARTCQIVTGLRGRPLWARLVSVFKRFR